MNYYPVLLNIEGLPVVVIGGGDVALRKVEELLGRGAMVTVVAPHICGELESLAAASDGRLRMLVRTYEPGDLEGAALVFSATNDPSVNRAVLGEAKSRNLFLNAVDDPEHCTFIVPSTLQRGDLTVSVSTGGNSPAMAARIRRDIEAFLPPDLEDTLEALKVARTLLQKSDAFATIDSPGRGRLLKTIVQSDELLRELNTAVAEGETEEFLARVLRLTGS
ncbi:MAG: bifunctional precorrin-2 dehydrogenase/sirohydrochlorin ferrochelatase [Spirochaetes bacterium]|nr:bifunctional precorrin-2 dehydrogenase/sirohydrochlorin ferrochelatase [Spirochaetota bacterium]